MRDFWHKLDMLVESAALVIDRPKGCRHPRFPDLVYPLDYGYLQGTSAVDGEGVDVWRGSDPAGALEAIVCTVDLDGRVIDEHESRVECVFPDSGEFHYLQKNRFRRADGRDVAW